MYVGQNYNLKKQFSKQQNFSKQHFIFRAKIASDHDKTQPSKNCNNIKIELVFFNINSVREITETHGIIRGKCECLNKKSYSNQDLTYRNEKIFRFVHPDFFVHYKEHIDNQNANNQNINHHYDNHIWTDKLTKYSLPYGLTSNDIKKAIRSLNIPEMQEWIPNKILEKNQWTSWSKSVLALHFAKDENEKTYAEDRLAFDELLFHHLNKESELFKTIRYNINHEDSLAFLSSYGIKSLTSSQSQALNEILYDISSEKITYRLLHGDVGSGKTIIAFLSALPILKSNSQVAFIAPTEILAKQHYENFTKAVENFTSFNISATILTGSQKEREKSLIRQMIAEKNDSPEGCTRKKPTDISKYFFSNKNINNKSMHISATDEHNHNLINIDHSRNVNIIFGTHALFEEKVQFAQLDYVIIDELHKFGVAQRNTIYKKGINGIVNMLIMSATPIPRTLEHALCGCIAVSKISQKLPDRIDTKTFITRKDDEIMHYISKLIQRGESGYWVCPSIEDNPDMASIDNRMKIFQKNNNIDINLIAIIHGQMSEEEKSQVIELFKIKQKQLLVSTTVIETGIDMPCATFIVIENADRFGLSQLHQLRGRVGRNNSPSVCFLHYNSYSHKTQARLKTMRETNDGFVIAEKDRQIRGSGEFYGTSQSGEFKIFNFVDFDKHSHLMSTAIETVKENSKNLALLSEIMSKITYYV